MFLKTFWSFGSHFYIMNMFLDLFTDLLLAKWYSLLGLHKERG